METQIQNLWDMVKSTSKRDISNDTSLPQGIKNNLKKKQHLTLCLKELEKQEQTKCKGSRRKEIRSKQK